MASELKRFVMVVVCLLLSAGSLSAQYGQVPAQPEITFGGGVDGSRGGVLAVFAPPRHHLYIILPPGGRRAERGLGAAPASIHAG